VLDPASTPIGSGLQGISDRLAALSGAVDIASALGRGTQITGRIPGPSDRGVSLHSQEPSQLVSAP
jgi:glucose-6-phosphate-specific signal transduction histidine kinase